MTRDLEAIKGEENKYKVQCSFFIIPSCLSKNRVLYITRFSELWSILKWCLFSKPHTLFLYPVEQIAKFFSEAKLYFEISTPLQVEEGLQLDDQLPVIVRHVLAVELLKRVDTRTRNQTVKCVVFL